MTKTIKTKAISLFMALLAIVTIMIIPSPAYASTTGTMGRSTIAQTVYAGPSSSNYTTIGSISAN